MIIAAIGVIFWGYNVLRHHGPFRTDSIVIIPKGSGTEQITSLLAQNGLVEHPTVFNLAVRTFGADKVLQAGEYSIPKGSSPLDILSILQSGRTVVRSITVAEGLNTSEILGRVIKTEGLSGLMTENPKEGQLLPETYHYSYGDSRNELVRRMKGAMSNALEELWKRRKSGLQITTREQAIILASLVEKETGLLEERERVASVFINRLRRGMRLQSDPTVIYGLTNGVGNLERPLNKTDLTNPNPYNTYLNKGLPPGPITNPGRASIEAVLNPIESRDLYFVADGTGGHAFARTLTEHNKNVSTWRNFLRGKNIKQ